jgi:hypothetical protein
MTDIAGKGIAWTMTPEVSVLVEVERACLEFQQAYERQCAEYIREMQPVAPTPYLGRFRAWLHRMRLRWFPWALTRIGGGSSD